MIELTLPQFRADKNCKKTSFTCGNACLSSARVKRCYKGAQRVGAPQGPKLPKSMGPKRVKTSAKVKAYIASKIHPDMRDVPGVAEVVEALGSGKAINTGTALGRAVVERIAPANKTNTHGAVSLKSVEPTSPGKRQQIKLSTLADKMQTVSRSRDGSASASQVLGQMKPAARKKAQKKATTLTLLQGGRAKSPMDSFKDRGVAKAAQAVIQQKGKTDASLKSLQNTRDRIAAKRKKKASAAASKLAKASPSNSRKKNIAGAAVAHRGTPTLYKGISIDSAPGFPIGLLSTPPKRRTDRKRPQGLILTP